MWVAARIVPALRRRARVAELAIASGLSEQLLDRSEESEWRAAFRHEGESFKRVDPGALTDDDLLGHLDRLKDLLDRGQVVHFRLSGAQLLPLNDLLVTCAELLGWDSVASLALAAGSSDASTEPGRELSALASRFAANPAAAQVLDDAAADVLARLEDASPELAEAFRAYLDRSRRERHDGGPGSGPATTMRRRGRPRSARVASSGRPSLRQPLPVRL